ncbi:MAG: transglycosylase domain-containing protein, partial [Polyangiaceae bacterium]
MDPRTRLPAILVAIVLPWRWRRWARVAGGVLLATIATAGITLLLVVRHYEAGLPSVAELRTYHSPQVTRVLARDGSVLAEIFAQRRTVVSLASLPAHVKLAVLAAEDAGFYEHEGLNYFGIVRAMVKDVRSRATRQGGS